MPETPFVLAPASSAHPALWPRIPAWWPLDEDRRDEAGNLLPPLTERERATARAAYAREKACQGPRDGIRGVVTYARNQGPPDHYEPDPGIRYTLEARRDGRLVYRYDPARSPRHVEMVQAVEAAFTEYGVTRASEALHEGSFTNP